MRKPMWVLVLFLSLLVLWAGWTYLTELRVEQPGFEVIEQKQEYEVRLYQPYLSASVRVEGEFDKALNEGFLLLADYIFGDNAGERSLAMTAPVTVDDGKQIAMTAPVTVEEGAKLVMTAPVTQEESEDGAKIISFFFTF